MEDNIVQNEQPKEPYHAPELTVYGDVDLLTRYGEDEFLRRAGARRIQQPPSDLQGIIGD